MSVHAGQIIHVGGNNVIDRIQNAGLGDVRVPIETIREVGNREVVDKIPGDPDFTFTLESQDVSTELEAWLAGKVGGTGSAAAPGAADPDGTEYSWDQMTRFVNIPSPWKDELTGSAGVVEAGHLVPAYTPNRIRYRYGVTDFATQEVELGGGSFYYAEAAPVEAFFTGDGSDTTFNSPDAAIGHREGGGGGTTFRRIFGVLVNGEIMVPDVDYTESGPENASAQVVTVTFTEAPVLGADIRFTYFTDAAKSYPKSVHASTLVKPGAVRGRNIVVYLGSGGARQRLGGVQAFELEATVDGDVEREFGNTEIVGRQVNGRDCNGSVTVRSKNPTAFFNLLEKVTGIPAGEVIGWLNLNSIPLEVAIQNPKNPGQILKTLYVKDAIFSIPGTPARVNAPTDFELRYESQAGTYSAFKGAKP